MSESDGYRLVKIDFTKKKHTSLNSCILNMVIINGGFLSPMTG